MAKRILAIDDDKKILNIIRLFLEGEGYKVRTAQDPKKGLAMARKGNFDLILLDIMMPGMDGYEVCRKLNEDSRTKETPVIMLTARAIILNTPPNVFYGLYGFLSKPFSGARLFKIVADVFRVTGEPAGKRTRASGPAARPAGKRTNPQGSAARPRKKRLPRTAKKGGAKKKMRKVTRRRKPD